MPEIDCYERTTCGPDYVLGLVVEVIASIDAGCQVRLPVGFSRFRVVARTFVQGVVVAKNAILQPPCSWHTCELRPRETYATIFGIYWDINGALPV